MFTLPLALARPRARARLACLTDHYAQRLVAVRTQMEELGLRPADVSDLLGRTSETDRVYVRSVLSAGAVSSPVLTDVEAVVAGVASARAAGCVPAAPVVVV